MARLRHSVGPICQLVERPERSKSRPPFYIAVERAAAGFAGVGDEG
jgi:hypothetical protein